VRITKWVEFAKEVEISISAEDVRSCFLSAADNSLPELFRVLNDTAVILKGIPDELIGKLTYAQLKTVHKFLVEQGKRFEPHCPACDETTEFGEEMGHKCCGDDDARKVEM
jgi:hypothetical protein